MTDRTHDQTTIQEAAHEQRLAPARRAVDAFVTRYGVAPADILRDPALWNALTVQARGVGRRELKEALEMAQNTGALARIPDALQPWIGRRYSLNDRGLSPAAPKAGQVYLTTADTAEGMQAVLVLSATKDARSGHAVANVHYLTGSRAGSQGQIFGGTFWRPTRKDGKQQGMFSTAPKGQASLFGTGAAPLPTGRDANMLWGMIAAAFTTNLDELSKHLRWPRKKTIEAMRKLIRQGFVAPEALTEQGETAGCHGCGTNLPHIAQPIDPATAAKILHWHPNEQTGAKMKNPYANKYHRNGDVTVWNVYTQSWERYRAGEISDRLLATMGEKERKRIAKMAAETSGRKTSKGADATDWRVKLSRKTTDRAARLARIAADREGIQPDGLYGELERISRGDVYRDPRHGVTEKDVALYLDRIELVMSNDAEMRRWIEETGETKRGCKTAKGTGAPRRRAKTRTTDSGSSRAAIRRAVEDATRDLPPGEYEITIQ